MRTLQWTIVGICRHCPRPIELLIRVDVLSCVCSVVCDRIQGLAQDGVLNGLHSPDLVSLYIAAADSHLLEKGPTAASKAGVYCTYLGGLYPSFYGLGEEAVPVLEHLVMHKLVNGDAAGADRVLNEFYLQPQNKAIAVGKG